jgi:hypothetical protein
MPRPVGVGQQHAGCRLNPMRRFLRSFITPHGFALLADASACHRRPGETGLIARATLVLVLFEHKMIT